VSYRVRAQRTWRNYLGAPRWLQIGIGLATVVLLLVASNWIYQVVRKPSELFFPVSEAMHKTPAATWREYGAIFRAHATAVMTPDLLAALAQVEASGNPVARTYWRFSPALHPFEIYRPASSAVGMYQITDGTFEQARRLCIHDHKVVDDGPWNAPHSCWFNSLYTRTVPSHAVELTAAYLDRQVVLIGNRYPKIRPTLAQKQALATLTHLCGAGTGAAYAARGYRLSPRQRCGDHDAAAYLARVAAMQRIFADLAQRRRGH
jgi:hypothetical protein